LVTAQLLLSPLCLEKEERLIEIDREKYMQRIDCLLDNWLRYGRGETGLFYIWMDARTNEPKPGFSQISQEHIPYEADTEEFKLPLALWYAWLLTGNQTYRGACKKAVDAWWGFAIDPKTKLAAAGFRWGYGGGVDARTGKWIEPMVVNWYAIPQVALFGHHKEYIESCESAFEKLIIKEEKWLYPAPRGIWTKNQIPAFRPQPDQDGCYYCDFLVTFLLPLWSETYDLRYIEVADAILSQFQELESEQTGVYPTQIMKSWELTTKNASKGSYDSAFMESTMSNLILYEVSGYESLHKKVNKDIDLALEKSWSPEKKELWRHIGVSDGRHSEETLDWWTEYCFVYELLQRYWETDEEKYLKHAKLLAENFLATKERLEQDQAFRPNELANAGMALLDLYQWTGEEQYIDGAVWLGDYIVDNMFYENGWLKFATDPSLFGQKEGTTADPHMTAWTIQFLLSLVYETFMPDWMVWEHIVGINSPYTLTNGFLELNDYRLNYNNKDIIFNLTTVTINSAEVWVNIPYSWKDGKVLLNGREIPFEEQILTARKYIVIEAEFQTSLNTVKVDF
jgi:hypothetical protein